MEKNMLNFNAKKFNAFNKGMENGELICKMLVNYKWSVAHLEKLDAKYAKVAKEQFNEMLKQFNVKLEADKKVNK